MAGFLLMRRRPNAWPIWPVSFGHNQPKREYLSPAFRLAVTETVPSSAALHRIRDGVMWVEGAARPAPGPLPFREWLAEADGSFRGVFFPVGEGVMGSEEAVVFTDPYGSRPIYYPTQHSCAVCAADKPAALVVAEPTARSLRWEAVLESLAIGCAAAPETSLESVRQVETGCAVRFFAGERFELIRYAPPPNEEGIRFWGLELGAKLLGEAVADATAESWTDTSVPLLLSGGFDSRWILKLGGPNRRTLTCTAGESAEVDMARRIARLYGAQHEVEESSPDRWELLLRDAAAITGGFFDPMKCHMLAEARHWAEQKRAGVCHGYMFDTVLKGYFALVPSLLPPRPTPSPYSPRAWEVAVSVFTPSYAHEVAGCLSPEGRSVLAEVLAGFDMRVPRRRVGGVEFGYERAVLGAIGRYGEMLAFMEYLPFHSPIFHKKIWAWWRGSLPSWRKPPLAFLLAFLQTGGEGAQWPKGDTGETAQRLYRRARLRQFAPEWMRQMAVLFRARCAPAPAETLQANDAALKGPPWSSARLGAWLRSKRGAELVREYLNELRGVPLFDANVLDRLSKGKDSSQVTDPRFLVALAAAGRWKQIVRTVGADFLARPSEHAAVDTVDLAKIKPYRPPRERIIVD